MNKFRLKFSVFIFLLMISMLMVSAKDIYVSPVKSDKSDGSIEHPFNSIQQAKAEVRKLIKSDLKEDINVFLMGGTYIIDETIVFSLADSPGKEYKVTYQAYNQEEPVISSLQTIKKWKKASHYPAFTPEVAKGKIWKAKIPEGFSSFKVMYKDGVKLQRAKSEKWSPVLPPDVSVIRQSDSRTVYYNKDRYRLRMVKYKNNELREWENIGDIELFINPVPWNLMLIPLESVDTKNKVGWLAYESNAQPGTKDPGHAPAFVYVENAIDFLDEPGEWVVNTQTRTIYYWPEEDEPGENIAVPALTELIKVEGKISYDLPTDIPVQNIHFKGITFTGSDREGWYKNRKGWGIQHDWDTFDHPNAMLRFRGAENCSVTESLFSHGGGSAIRLDLYAQNIVIENNLIEHVGHMGVLLCGYGPGIKDVNKNNKVSNNIIHSCGELVFHGHGIFLWQSGHNEISNNWIHDVPRKAIGVCGVRSQILMKPDVDFDEASKTIRWNEIESVIDSTLDPQDRYFPFLHARKNLVKDNKITRTMLKLSDGSSLNISGAGAGNIIEHNLLVDLFFTAIRTDDWQDETYIKNNIVWKCGGNAFIFKGHNYLTNNIAVDVAKAVHLRSFPQQTFKPDAVIANNIFMSDSEDFVIYIPIGWPEWRNPHRPGNDLMPYEHIVDNNVYWYPNGEAFLKEQKTHGIEKNTVFADPLFVDAKNGDFRLKKKSPALKLGFIPFDVSLESFGTTKFYPEKYKKMDDEALLEYEQVHKNTTGH